MPDGQPNNIWPHLLTQGELGPQARLVQWSILIGSLLIVVLLIMLILRKLLARSTPSYHWMLAKQTLKTSADCCNHRHHLSSASHLDSAILLNSDGTTRSQPVPPHAHFANLCNSSQNQYQFVLDADGRQHLLAASGSLSGFTCASGNKRHVDQHSLLSSNYDTLQSSKQVTTNNSSDANTHLPPTNQPRCQLATGEAAVFGAQAKHRSPNVPATLDNGIAARTSRSPSISSSSSVQSTTAQMLSNAASSSFEQPPEFTCCEPSPGVTVLSSSPLSLQAAKLRPVGKLVPATVQSQPNSPMFANQFNPQRSARKFTSTAVSRAPKLTSRLLNRTIQQRVTSHTSLNHQPSSIQDAQFNNQRCDNTDTQTEEGEEVGRHFYEEISQQKQQHNR